MTKDKLVPISKAENEIAAQRQKLLDKQEEIIALVTKRVDELKKEVTRIGEQRIRELQAKFKEKREQIRNDEALGADINVDMEELTSHPTFIPGVIDVDKLTALVGTFTIQNTDPQHGADDESI